jgi:hypothetical protein
MLGVIEDQIHGVPRLRGQGPEQFLHLLLQRGFGVPALDQEEVIEVGPVGRWASR